MEITSTLVHLGVFMYAICIGLQIEELMCVLCLCALASLHLYSTRIPAPLTPSSAISLVYTRLVFTVAAHPPPGGGGGNAWVAF